MGHEGIVDDPQLAADGDFAEGVIGRGCTAELFVIMSVCPSWTRHLCLERGS